MEQELLRWFELVTATLEAAAPVFPAERLARELALTYDASVVEVGWGTGPPRPEPRVALSGFGLEPSGRPARGAGPPLLTFTAVPARHRATPDGVVLARRLVPMLSALLQCSADPRRRALGVPTGSGPSLTTRELSVLGLLQLGLTAAGIGHRLDISERTVHKHLEAIYRKLRVGDRLSAVAAAQRQGLLAVPA